MKSLIKPFLLLCFFTFLSNLLIAQIWTNKTSFPGNVRINSVCFTLGNKGYVTTGKAGNNHLGDLWEYDFINDIWTQKANFLGNGRVGAIGLAYNGSGYVGIGWDGSSYYNDFYQYFPSINGWIQRANYPGYGRRNNFAIASTTAGKIYVGGGGSYTGNASSDFYEYDPVVDQWTLISNNWVLGGRMAGISFSVDSIVFFGMGHNQISNFQDLWGYNTNTGLWRQYTNFPGVGRIHATVFVYNNIIVVGGGYQYGSGTPLSDYYTFNLNTNTWSILNATNTPVTKLSAEFYNGSQAFISLGQTTNGTLIDSTWEFNYLTSLFDEANKKAQLNVFPNPVSDYLNIETLNSTSGTISIFDINGKEVRNRVHKNGIKLKVNVSDLNPGVYLLNYKGDDQTQAIKRIVIK